MQYNTFITCSGFKCINIARGAGSLIEFSSWHTVHFRFTCKIKAFKKGLWTQYFSYCLNVMPVFFFADLPSSAASFYHQQRPPPQSRRIRSRKCSLKWTADLHVVRNWFRLPGTLTQESKWNLKWVYFFHFFFFFGQDGCHSERTHQFSEGGLSRGQKKGDPL